MKRGMLAGLAAFFLAASLHAGANYSRTKTWSDGEILTHTDLNAEFDNILNNHDPDGMDDYSSNTSQMQATTDPYPGSVESLATSLAGELERLRYVIKQLSGESQWYIDPDASIASLYAAIPSGTKMLFYQSACPSGWTGTGTTLDDRFVRVVTTGTTGGTVGGSGLVASSTITINHSHTVNSHTHDLGNHTHSTPAHTHTLVNGSSGGLAGGTPTDTPVHVASAGGAMNTTTWGGGGTHTLQQVSATTNTGEGSGTSGSPSTNTSGGTAPGTDSQLTNVSFQYASVIVCTRD